MTRVLIPTDFSKNSWNAIQFGLRFFSKEPCCFYLLHVNLAGRQESSGDTVANSLFFDVAKSTGAQDKLLGFKQRIEEIFPNTNHKFHAIREHGFFVEGIKRTIREKHIDFIVMGTKGASGLKEATIGSKTGEVITRVKCPVFVIPEKARYTSVKEIAFPTDFNSFFKNKIFLTLAEVMAMNNATLNVLHIGPEGALSPSQRANKVELEDFLEHKPHKFHYLYERNIEAGLNAYIEKHPVDLIAMVAKNINFFQRLLFKPTVTKISYHTETPFLVLHE